VNTEIDENGKGKVRDENSNKAPLFTERGENQIRMAGRHDIGISQSEPRAE
jgi:hypothetical protein